eukprot:738396-Ditylum_brightwellii.AAC.1
MPDSDCESVSPVCNKRKLDKSFAQHYYKQTPTSKKVLTLLAMTEGLNIKEQREALKSFVKEGMMKFIGSSHLLQRQRNAIGGADSEHGRVKNEIACSLHKSDSQKELYMMSNLLCNAKDSLTA